MAASEMPKTWCPAFWWCRPTLSRRIAAAMILSLVAIQGQAFVQIRYLSSPEFRLVGTRWLAEKVVAATHDVLALPPQQRAGYAARRFDPSVMSLTWQASTATLATDDSRSPVAAQLHATLTQLMGEDVRSIRISATSISYRFPTKAFRLVVIPDGEGSRFGSAALRSDEPDVLMPAGVRIDIEGLDGSWLRIEPVGTSDSAFGATLPYVPLLIGGLIIATVSTLMARRFMTPLDNLVVAANRFGASREPVTVPRKGLYEFAAVAQAFEDMQGRMLRMVDDRTEMLAAISHDLRSSLTRLRLAAEEVAGEPERRALSAEIEDMKAMVDSTLAFASGEARAVPNQRVDMAASLMTVIDDATDAGAACAYSGPDHAEIMGHPVALRRAFRNLVDNAIKYGGAARVSLTVEDASIMIAIEDDGPGIPAERLDEAFAPFRRLNSARSAAGVGLGLTIARDVIHSHGGEISGQYGATGKFQMEARLPRGPSVSADEPVS
jgi:signal transduction histidine kinase